MKKEAFTDLLQSVSVASRDFASRYVHNALPDSFLYFVHLNQSFDNNPLKPNELIFPDDVAKFGERVGPLAIGAVVDLIWRDGLLPEWVDISTVQADAQHTYFQLLCCGRFTSDDALLYYAKRGQGPFGIKSPKFPPHWSEKQERFDLHWHRSQD
jgi:hypothetical protein